MATLAAMLLAAAASAMLVDARAARGASGEVLRLAQARETTQALAAAGLVRLDQDETRSLTGVIYENADLGVVRRQDASGLVDLNFASHATLSRLLSGLGASPDAATHLASRIIDWRDEDDLTFDEGSERRLYEEAGRSPPPNRPFDVERGLDQVLGLTPALVRCLEPYLTTYGAAPEIDVNTAPSHVRAVLQAGPPALQSALEPPIGHVVKLDADAALSGAASLRLALWVRLTGDARAPFLIHRASESFIAADAEIETTCDFSGSTAE